MTASTSLSLALFAALLVGTHGSCADGCIPTLAAAQDCLRQCGNKNPVPEWGGRYDFATNGGSRLFQCLPDFNENGVNKTKVFDPNDGLNDLTLCCEMSAECQATMQAARGCADPQTGCIDTCVKNTAKDYLTCISNQATLGECRFASLCVGQLTGSDTFDFAATLASDANAAALTQCTSMEGFVDGICEISEACCSECNDKMTGMAGCLVNELILPESSSAGTQCQIQAPVGGTCEVAGTVTTAARSAAIPEKETTQEGDIDVDGVDISDCEERLTLEFIVHNATYAADGFMKCIGKKVGKVLAETEGDNVSNPEPAAAGASSATLVLSAAAVAMVASSMLA